MGSWSIPVGKALRSLPFYVGIPFVIYAVGCGIFGNQYDHYQSGEALALIEVAFFVWFLRQVVRFTWFAWKRRRYSTPLIYPPRHY
jgi:hypothetical protein